MKTVICMLSGLVMVLAMMALHYRSMVERERIKATESAASVMSIQQALESSVIDAERCEVSSLLNDFEYRHDVLQAAAILAGEELKSVIK